MVGVVFVIVGVCVYVVSFIWVANRVVFVGVLRWGAVMLGCW